VLTDNCYRTEVPKLSISTSSSEPKVLQICKITKLE
jgi:hypothetical protein